MKMMMSRTIYLQLCTFASFPSSCYYCWSQIPRRIEQRRWYAVRSLMMMEHLLVGLHGCFERLHMKSWGRQSSLGQRGSLPCGSTALRMPWLLSSVAVSYAPLYSSKVEGRGEVRVMLRVSKLFSWIMLSFYGPQKWRLKISIKTCKLHSTWTFAESERLPCLNGNV